MPRNCGSTIHFAPHAAHLVQPGRHLHNCWTYVDNTRALRTVYKSNGGGGGGIHTCRARQAPHSVPRSRSLPALQPPAAHFDFDAVVDADTLAEPTTGTAAELDDDPPVGTGTVDADRDAVQAGVAEVDRADTGFNTAGTLDDDGGTTGGSTSLSSTRLCSLNSPSGSVGNRVATVPCSGRLYLS